MSDTTTFLAGCATTGVAVLVLLVAKVGLGNSDTDKLRSELSAMEATIPTAAVPVPSAPVMDMNTARDQGWNEDLRHELEKQKEVTAKLESQLTQQDLMVRNLENQLKQQQSESRVILSQLTEYQRSVDTLTLRNSQLAESTNQQQSGLQTTLMWLGGGLLLVIVLGGGALIVCLIVMAMQSQRRQERGTSMPVMYPVHMTPPTPNYGYYEQEFLPPQPLRQRRAKPYYDYEG